MLAKGTIGRRHSSGDDYVNLGPAQGTLHTQKDVPFALHELEQGFHIETVDRLHLRAKLRCPICGMDRSPDRAEAGYCDDACYWLSQNDPATGGTTKICAADDCSVRLWSSPRGRPRKFCSELCEKRQNVRLTRERQASRSLA